MTKAKENGMKKKSSQQRRRNAINTHRAYLMDRAHNGGILWAVWAASAYGTNPDAKSECIRLVQESTRQHA